MAESEGFIPIKAEKVVDVGLGLLERDTVLASTVWRDAAGDFRGAKNDTISIRLPAYAAANKRALRSSDARVRSKLNQRKVDVTLTDDLQVDVPITDEELTLDIMSLANDVIAPSLSAIVRGYEQEVADLMADATYTNELAMDGEDPYPTLTKARRALNDASVPVGGRFLAVGSGVEEAILNSSQFRKFDEAGSDSALREAQMGRIAGFTPFVSSFLAPDEAYAYHRSAYILNTRAPFIPQGVAWGASESRNGFAIRVVQFLDPAEDIVNVVAHDAWVGTNTVSDFGRLDDDGKFIPGIDPNDPGEGEDELFVRAVKLAITS